MEIDKYVLVRNETYFGRYMITRESSVRSENRLCAQCRSLSTRHLHKEFIKCIFTR